MGRYTRCSRILESIPGPMRIGPFLSSKPILRRHHLRWAVKVQSIILSLFHSPRKQSMTYNAPSGEKPPTTPAAGSVVSSGLKPGYQAMNSMQLEGICAREIVCDTSTSREKLCVPVGEGLFMYCVENLYGSSRWMASRFSFSGS